MKIRTRQEQRKLHEHWNRAFTWEGREQAGNDGSLSATFPSLFGESILLEFWKNKIYRFSWKIFSRKWWNHNIPCFPNQLEAAWNVDSRSLPTKLNTFFILIEKKIPKGRQNPENPFQSCFAKNIESLNKTFFSSIILGRTTRSLPMVKGRKTPNA